MIDQITLKNFKGIKKVVLPCGALTLLAGANASGKSTLLQSLLILAQSDFATRSFSVTLNGAYCRLGTVSEIEHEFSEENEIVFSYTAGPTSLSLKIEAKKNDERDVIVIKDSFSSKSTKFIKSIKYLSASRIGPSNIFQHSTYETENNKNIGIDGEYTISYLAKYGNDRLPVRSLRHKDDQKFGIEGTLAANVTAWLQEISPGVSFKAETLQSIGASVLSYQFPGLGAERAFTSHNVGFGLTYVLPVLTRILMSKRGDILLLENPEAHVQPKGQVALGRLLALASQFGIQVFVETHSDHVFNGIRLQFKAYGFEKCKMYYVTRNTHEKDSFETEFNEIVLAASGRIQSAPTGFFDQWETSVLELI